MDTNEVSDYLKDQSNQEIMPYADSLILSRKEQEQEYKELMEILNNESPIDHRPPVAFSDTKRKQYQRYQANENDIKQAYDEYMKAVNATKKREKEELHASKKSKKGVKSKNRRHKKKTQKKNK
jgi:hypothetical protein